MKDDRNIDCVDSGEGPALLFLPGSYSTPAAWRPLQRLLGPGWRMLTTSLCGYGGTVDTRTWDDCAIEHELRLVQAVAERVNGPVHLVGHSFGGAIALVAALSGTLRVASLSLFEANPLDMLWGDAQGAALHRDTLDMSLDFAAAAAAGEPDAAARIIDFWGNPGAFAAMPEAVKAYCRETAAVNVLDWRCAWSVRLKAQDCARLEIPVLLVRGSLANDAMVKITGALESALPDVRSEVVDGAGHFLITSHPQQCASLLSSFLTAAT